MKRETIIKINDIMQKYSIALNKLYPGQKEALQDSLAIFFEEGKVRKLSDPFANLAFYMIICDCIDKEKRQGAQA